jgi:hypothetical protein
MFHTTESFQPSAAVKDAKHFITARKKLDVLHADDAHRAEPRGTTMSSADHSKRPIPRNNQ